MTRKRRTGLTVVTGCMFSGKTEGLVGFLSVRNQFANQKVQAFSPAKDTRSGDGQISAKNGASFPAQTVEKSWDVRELVADDTDLVVIDEAQFFDPFIVEVVRRLMTEHEVFVAGLNLDFRGEPFGQMPQLMALADEIQILKAVCKVCGEDATRTQRMANGEPAHYDDPVILVGGADYYEARCVRCHEVRRGLR